MPLLQLLGDGIVQTVAQLAVVGGTLVLVLLLIAGGAFAYRQLRGEGVEWPEETDDETVSRGDEDDEWDYY